MWNLIGALLVIVTLEALAILCGLYCIGDLRRRVGVLEEDNAPTRAVTMQRLPWRVRLALWWHDNRARIARWWGLS